MVSSKNQDIKDEKLATNWQTTFAPYALFMAATSNPDLLLPILEKLEDYKSGDSSLYQKGVGWMDGLHVSGKQQGKVVSAQIALNQSMIALSVLQILSNDGMTPSARALYNNAAFRSRMQFAAQIMDQKLSP